MIFMSILKLFEMRFFCTKCTYKRVAAYCPNKDYALNVSITALFLFLAAPFLYSAFNSLTVPNVDSLYTVKDVYTKASTGTPICSEELKSFE